MSEWEKLLNSMNRVIEHESALTPEQLNRAGKLLDEWVDSWEDQ